MEETWDRLTGAGVATAVLGVLVLVALIVAPRDRRPSSALAWILLISFLPVVGLVLFALIGSPRLPRGRHEKQQDMTALITRAVPHLRGGSAGSRDAALARPST